LLPVFVLSELKSYNFSQFFLSITQAALLGLVHCTQQVAISKTPHIFYQINTQKITIKKAPAPVARANLSSNV